MSFNKSDPLKYAQYVQHLESFLQSKFSLMHREMNVKTDWKLAVIKQITLPSFSPWILYQSIYLNVFLFASLFLSEYNDTEQEKNEECIRGQYYEQDDTESREKKACRFKRGSLALCSGLSDTNFGYSEGKPCILLKMNRVNLKIHEISFKIYNFVFSSRRLSTFIPSHTCKSPFVYLLAVSSQN